LNRNQTIQDPRPPFDTVDEYDHSQIGGSPRKTEIGSDESFAVYVNYAEQQSDYSEQFLRSNLPIEEVNKILAREQLVQYQAIWKGVQTMPLRKQNARTILAAAREVNIKIGDPLSNGKSFKINQDAPPSKYRTLMNQLILRDIRQLTFDAVLQIAKNLELIEEKIKSKPLENPQIKMSIVSDEKPEKSTKKSTSLTSDSQPSRNTPNATSEIQRLKHLAFADWTDNDKAFARSLQLGTLPLTELMTVKDFPMGVWTSRQQAQLLRL
jgi:hypothetical protein